MNIERNSFQEDKTEIHARKQEEKKKTHLGSIRPQKGHTLWEINMTTREIVPAEFEAVVFGQENRKQVIAKPNCYYVSALNIKNAKKKMIKAVINRLI